jgi:hypothetical protein
VIEEERRDCCFPEKEGFNPYHNFQESRNSPHRFGRALLHIPGRNEALAAGHNNCSYSSEKIPGCISNNDNDPSIKISRFFGLKLSQEHASERTQGHCTGTRISVRISSGFTSRGSFG